MGCHFISPTSPFMCILRYLCFKIVMAQNEKCSTGVGQCLAKSASNLRLLSAADRRRSEESSGRLLAAHRRHDLVDVQQKQLPEVEATINNGSANFLDLLDCSVSDSFKIVNQINFDTLTKHQPRDIVLTFAFVTMATSQSCITKRQQWHLPRTPLY